MAHLPTWKAAQGGEEQGGVRRYVPSKMVSKLDMPSQINLKLRADGQGNAAELAAKDLKAALAEKERAHFLKSSGGVGAAAAQEDDFEQQKQEDLRLLEHLSNIPGSSGGGDGEKPRMALVPNAADADLEDSDDDDDSDDSEDDEEAELLAELERIKKERAEEAAKKTAQEAAEVEEAERAELMGGNPLLAGKLSAAGGGASFALKRRWDEDVVFRNQARGEPKQQRRFINDTIRSDFHRRFLDKYLK